MCSVFYLNILSQLYSCQSFNLILLNLFDESSSQSIAVYNPGSSNFGQIKLCISSLNEIQIVINTPQFSIMTDMISAI